MFFSNAKKSTNRKTASSNSRLDCTISTRPVADRRWVHCSQLEVGMYVNELDKPWEQTRFMFQGFVIDSNELLRQVQDACEYADVQTTKLAKVSSKSTHRLVGRCKPITP